jgi:trimeric autotransporter adhesin
MVRFSIYLFYMKLKNYNFILLLLITVFSAVSVRAQYISTFAGTGTAGYTGDGGLALTAQFNGCSGVAVDGAGNIYIADQGNNVVRRISFAGVISTFAGTGTAGYSGNGGQASLAQLNQPVAVATDAAGNVYISDMGNSTVRIVNTLGIISNYAGNGTAGYTGNGGNANLAQLNNPVGIALDAAGNLYIADALNNVIRKVEAGTQFMTTYAGSGAQGNSGDGGPAAMAKMYAPSSVAVDVSGNVYIADQLNNTIRKVSAATGLISNFAGNGAAGNSGDGGLAVAAGLRYPSSVSVDGAGNVYIADQGNYNIRMVTTDGMIHHVAGASTNGYDGDGGLAATAKMGAPKAVYVDGWSRIYIADNNNHAIRVITATSGTPSLENNRQLSIYPNPANGRVMISLPAGAGEGTVSVSDILGNIVATSTASANLSVLNTASWAKGNYMVRVITERGSYTGKLCVN